MRPLKLISTGALLLLFATAPIYTIAQEPDKQQDEKQEEKPQKDDKQPARVEPEKQAPVEQEKDKQPEHTQVQLEEKGRTQEQPKQQAIDKDKQPQPAINKDKQEQPAVVNDKHAQPAQQDRQVNDKNANDKNNEKQAHAQPQQAQNHHVSQQQQAAWHQERRASNWSSEHRTWKQRGGYRGYRIPQNNYSVYFGSSHTFQLYSYPVQFVGGYPRFQYQGLWFSIVDPVPADWPDDWYEEDTFYIDYTDDGYYLFNTAYPGEALAVVVYQ